MKNKIRKTVACLAICLMVPCLLTGCKPSKKKVLSSTYYKELKDQYQDLKKENAELEEELKKKDEPTADEQRAMDYLDKIGRDSIVKLEVGYADNMDGSEFVEDKAAFALATAIARRADITQKYTPEEIEEKYGPGYGYVLYDEDNAIYEMTVYAGNYIIFTDLPNNVYYSYNASALGDAFLHYKNGYPNSTLMHRLADCAVITSGEKCYENDTAVQVANYIRDMYKEKSSRAEAEEDWKQKAGAEEATEEGASFEPSSKVYHFYHHGNTMTLTLYDKYICIENMNGNRTWYKVEKEEIKNLKKLFVQAAEAEVDHKAADKSESSEPSHSKEIEEESILSNAEEE